MSSFLKKYWKVIALLLFGIFLRYAVSLIGGTYDLESYHVVGKLVTQGKNVYAETYRYNYGPVWALILGFFRLFAEQVNNINLNFRLLIITTLTLSDLAIFFWIRRVHSRRAALWFFLNPISIYITGYHNQFDTLAIALALYASLLIYNKKFKWNVLGLILLGLSLSVKHIFAFYPLWLLLGPQKLKNKYIFFLPILIFAGSFVPFLFSSGAGEGIWTNVLTYKKSTALYSFFPVGIVRPLLMIIPMLIGAYIFRREKPYHQVLWYLLILVAISPITAGQYFVIPLVSFAVLSMPTGIFFTLFCLWGLFVAKLPLIPLSIIAFALCWIPLIFYFSSWIKKHTQPILIGGSFLLLTSMSYYTYVSMAHYAKEQKKEFFILKVLHPAAQVFPTENSNNPHHIVLGKKIEGSFIAISNSLGFITVPFFLENPLDDFFKKDYTVSLSAWANETPSRLYKEQRNIAGGLSQDGLILGLPLMKDSKDKRYHITVTSTIPERPDYITIDPFSFVQSRYFLTKSEIVNPSFIMKFLWYKTCYLLSLQKTGELLFYLYCIVWGVATAIPMLLYFCLYTYHLTNPSSSH